MTRSFLPAAQRFGLLGGLIAVLSLFPSCDEETDDTPVELQVRFTPGGALFNPATIYTINGTAVQFNTLRFYLSGIQLEDIAGNTVSTNAYVLAQPNDDAYSLGNVPPQAYTAFNFNVGIDSATNHLDPTQYASSNPLAPQSPNMHWSWTSGYIFLRIDGIYDGDGDGTPESGSGFEVHLGADNFLSTLSIPGSFGGDDAETLTLTLNYDPLALFTSIDFPTVNTTHTMDNLPMAMQVKANIPAAFSLVP
ncbi:MAG: hypothetical protein GC205_08655 [Bacteroidetes bacterium]|nr:hypothetical protein [Bacteroidota bacterium]